MIAVIPQDKIFGWADMSRGPRAAFLAQYVPKTLDMGGGGHLTRAFLSRYGDREDVRRALFCNFESEGWRGPPSQHVHSKIEAAKRWLAGTHNENVERWLSEYLLSLESRLEHELVQEERGG